MFVAQIERRRGRARRLNLVRRAVGWRGKSSQAAVYDATFRSDREAVAYHYAVVNDHLPDLDDPTWLNEKIRWQFLNHPNPLMSLAADKLAVRDYLLYKGAVIDGPEILASGADADDFPRSGLPRKWVLKSSFGSGQKHLEDTDSQTDRRILMAKLKKWNVRDRWRETGEMHYRQIQKRWLVEEYLPADRRKLEYKIFCTLGEPVYISVVLERDPATGNVTLCSLLDPHWRRINLGVRKSALEYTAIPKPPELDLLLSEARRLSQDFLHVRVDFLHFNDRLIFSELTFANLAARVPLEPLAANAELGAMMNLDRAGELLERGKRIAAELGWANRAA